MKYVYLNKTLARVITTLSVVFCGLFLVTGLVVHGQIDEANQSIQNQLTQNQPVETTPLANPPIKLGVRVISPFIIKKDTNKTTVEESNYTGFSIELWGKIKEKAGIQSSEIKEYSTVGNLLEGVQNREVDAGIAAISITSERDQKVDFTQPMFNSGLKIAVRGSSDKPSELHSTLFQKIAQAIWSRDFGLLALFILLGSLIPAHIAYFTELRRKHGVFARNYIIGIGEAYWWTITALAGQAEQNPKTKVGRVVTVLWMFTSIIFIAFFTASITSDLTASKLQGDINSISDLSGKRVVSVTSSTASKYLTDKNIEHDDVKTPQEAFDKLENNGRDAFVYDAPALEYYENHNGKGKVHAVGEVFKPEGYGIAIQQGSPLRTKLNQALLSIREDGSYDELYTKYFGK